MFIGEFFEEYIPPTGKIVDFGCGDGSLTKSMRYITKSPITGYDPHLHLRKPSFKSLADFTDIKPNDKFDVATLIFSLHHDPLNIPSDLVSVLNPDAYVCMLDYDMKGISKENFERVWWSKREKWELEVLGFDKCYNMHTSFSAKDLENLLADHNIFSIKTRKYGNKFSYLGLYKP